MKKSIIAAGAASAVLAAMPIAGVFADDNLKYIDSFSLQIQDTCTLTRKVTGSDNGHPTGGYNNTAWQSGTGTDDAALTDTMNIGAVMPGQVYSLGSSNFNVRCNNSKGYTLTATVTSLSNTTTQISTDAIAAGETALSESQGAYTGSTSNWTVFATPANGTGKYLTGTDTVMTENSSNFLAGRDLNVVYSVGLVETQAAGTYTGTVTYNLAKTAIGA